MYINGEALGPYTRPWEYRLIEVKGKQYRLAYGKPIPDGAEILKENLEPSDRECSFERWR